MPDEHTFAGSMKHRFFLSFFLSCTHVYMQSTNRLMVAKHKRKLIMIKFNTSSHFQRSNDDDGDKHSSADRQSFVLAFIFSRGFVSSFGFYTPFDSRGGLLL